MSKMQALTAGGGGGVAMAAVGGTRGVEGRGCSEEGFGGVRRGRGVFNKTKGGINGLRE